MVYVTSDELNQRIPLLSSVECVAGEDLPSRVLSMLDLGTGGVFVQTSYPLPVGASLKIKFYPGDGPDPVESTTEVTWSRPGPEGTYPPPGMGLKFIDLKVEDQERIRHIIKIHNDFAQYYEKYDVLPEDAMKFQPPVIRLEAKDGTQLSGKLNSHCATNMNVTIALPFLQENSRISCQIPDRGVEEGRISWLRFEQDELSGTPQVRMGLEFSLQSWGEERIKRSTMPLHCWQETSDGEFGEESGLQDNSHNSGSLQVIGTVNTPKVRNLTGDQIIGNSEIGIPEACNLTGDQTSGDVVEPLPPQEMEPICDLKNTQSDSFIPPKNEIVADIINKNNYIEFAEKPVLVKKDKNIDEMPEFKRPQTIPDLSSEINFPPPVYRKDTFPALATGASTWPLTKIATVGVFVILAAGFGIVALKNKGESQKTLENQSDDKLKVLLQGDPVYEHQKGKAIESVKTKHVPTLPATDNINKKETIKEIAINKGDLSTKEESENSVDKPEKNLSLRKDGKYNKLSIQLGEKGTKSSWYALASPPGIVVDLESQTSMTKGIHVPGKKILRKLKVIKRANNRERIILYTWKKPEKVSVSSKSEILTVKFL
ncbi:PilZ domain-containing protein [Myxococcota bacterium]|nr:PilZ domain-containing protein [Myxococcota bacterium]MBU1382508.1 PilZ domain-containing protein [Myxococcota bacterium]MBU1497582.1 PilZ domain-containing protein [Myxococcota bacterium]